MSFSRFQRRLSGLFHFVPDDDIEDVDEKQRVLSGILMVSLKLDFKDGYLYFLRQGKTTAKEKHCT